MKLNAIRSVAGSRPKRKRLGCGVASGQGKTGGRGHKGQKSRSGGKVMRGFEGGQMPLIRRLPKRGFTSRNKECYQLVNVGQLAVFENGGVVDTRALFEAGLVRSSGSPVKLLARGDLDVALEIRVDAASKAAVAKIEKADGRVIVTGAV